MWRGERIATVAVVGGGITGSVAGALLKAQGLGVTLFDRGTRLGGRASAKHATPTAPAGGGQTSRSNALTFDQGAQFVTATDKRFEMLARSPLMKGLLRPWDSSRLAVLGCAGGTPSVLQRDAMLGSRMFATPKAAPNVTEEEGAQQVQQQREEQLANPMNFCGFLEGETHQPLYVGTNGMGGLCEQLLQRVKLQPAQGATVDGVHYDAAMRSWRVDASTVESGAPHFESPTWCADFDYLVLANHDPTFAADTIDGLLQASAPGDEMALEEVSNVVAHFSERLRALRATRSSRYTLMLAFERPLHELEFDAASLHGSEALSFISRDSSKRAPSQQQPYECWIAHSTPEFATWLDQATGHAVDEAQASQHLLAAFEAAVGGSFEGRVLPPLVHIQSHRWGNGFYPQTLQLNAHGETHNDAVTFEPWALAVCGDYLGERQGVQEAALSGMMAANRLCEWAARRRGEQESA